MIRKINRLLIAIGVAIVCIACQSSYFSIRYDKIERFTAATQDQTESDFASVLMDFYDVYGRAPMDADELLRYVRERNSGESFNVYYSELYDILERNRADMILESDTATMSILYKRNKRNSKELVARVNTSFYAEIYSEGLPAPPPFKVYRFDNNGEWINDYSPINSEIIKSVIRYYYIHQRTPHFDRGEKIVFEYTPNQLRNRIDSTLFDIESSEYFRDVYDYLDSTAKANNYSMIAVPTIFISEKE